MWEEDQGSEGWGQGRGDLFSSYTLCGRCYRFANTPSSPSQPLLLQISPIKHSLGDILKGHSHGKAVAELPYPAQESRMVEASICAELSLRYSWTFFPSCIIFGCFSGSPREPMSSLMLLCHL